VVTGAGLVSSTSSAGVIQVYQVSLSITGDGSVDVLFTAIPDRSYQVERSTNLQTWTLQKTLNAAANGTLLFHDAAPPVGAAYYRARETP